MKNTHLQHPEDSILTGNLNVLDWFTTPDSHLSVKMDGAPAIVWGTNPKTGNFFVGTKSVFNKVKIKINESHDDIDRNHQGNVAHILHKCFDYLPHIDLIVQGDFIGFGGDNAYQPNTIVYVFPDIVMNEIIIAPHTGYYAKDDLRDAISFPLTEELPSNDDVLFVQSNGTINGDIDDIKQVCKFAKQMSTLCEFVDKNTARKMEKVFNTFIRLGAVLNEQSLHTAMKESVSEDIDINLIRLWLLVKSIKDDALHMCSHDSDIQSFIETQRIDCEGYVMNNEDGMYKLVNREEFSRANFLVRQW